MVTNNAEREGCMPTPSAATELFLQVRIKGSRDEQNMNAIKQNVDAMVHNRTESRTRVLPRELRWISRYVPAICRTEQLMKPRIFLQVARLTGKVAPR